MVRGGVGQVKQGAFSSIVLALVETVLQPDVTGMQCHRVGLLTYPFNIRSSPLFSINYARALTWSLLVFAHRVPSSGPQTLPDPPIAPLPVLS